VPDNNGVRVLTKLPIPAVSEVLELAVVGAVVVAQQTPLAVIVPPPSAVTFPPETAVVKAIELMAVVVTVGAAIETVTNEISFPYAVPTLFVAYARK
jgi:hypothetical protein